MSERSSQLFRDLQEANQEFIQQMRNRDRSAETPLPQVDDLVDGAKRTIDLLWNRIPDGVEEYVNSENNKIVESENLPVVEQLIRRRSLCETYKRCADKALTHLVKLTEKVTDSERNSLRTAIESMGTSCTMLTEISDLEDKAILLI